MPVGRRRDRRGEIVDAAVRVFKRRGFQGSTLEDVARHLHVTRPALYYYIQDKQELLYDIYDQTMAKAMAGSERIVRGAGPPQERLGRLIRSYVDLVGRHDMLTIFFQDKASLKPEHFVAITGRERAFVRLFEDLYRDGIRRGEFRPVDPTVVAFGMIGMCSWMYKWFDPRGRLSSREVGRLFEGIILRGVLAAGSRRRRKPRGRPHAPARARSREER